MHILKQYPQQITLKTGVRVEAIDAGGHPEHFRLHTSQEVYTSDILIIATGGNAYRHTGSTGDGYSFAESLGHSITKI